MTDDELRRRGVDVLARELGPVDMARFLQQVRATAVDDASRRHHTPENDVAASEVPCSGDSETCRGGSTSELIPQRPEPVTGGGLDDTAARPPSYFTRGLSSRAFVTCGLIAAPLLLLLALWMPQVPRQRAIRAVEAAGGDVYFADSIPGWLYELCGERVEYLEAATEIHLDGTGVDDGLMPQLRLLNTASVVWLNGARVTDQGVSVLLEFPNITSLDLGDTAVTEATLVPLLRQHRQLETIWLQGTAAGDASLEVLGGTSTLQELLIPRTRITDKGLKHLARLPVLEELDLSETAVGDNGMASLSASRTLTNLALEQSEVSDAALEHLARMPALEQINLIDTRITGTGLASLSRAPRLNRLYLDRTLVSEVGLEHVAAMRSLELLSLTGTRVTDAGLAKLESAKQLRQLYVGAIPASPEAIVRLRRALPDCTIDESNSGMGQLPR